MSSLKDFLSLDDVEQSVKAIRLVKERKGRKSKMTSTILGPSCMARAPFLQLR